MPTQDEKRSLLKDLQAGKITLPEFKQKIAGDNDELHVIEFWRSQYDGTLINQDTGEVLTQAEYDALPGNKITFDMTA